MEKPRLNNEISEHEAFIWLPERLCSTAISLSKISNGDRRIYEIWSQLMIKTQHNVNDVVLMCSC